MNSHYLKSKNQALDDRKMKRSHENLGRKSQNSDTLKPINEFISSNKKSVNFTNQRKSINLESIESGLLWLFKYWKLLNLEQNVIIF